jgi:GNAT superfamily N-acetyltransferase
MVKSKQRNRPVVRFECHPLTRERWSDFEALFGPRGACGGYWCMAWRLARKDFDRGKGAGNRLEMQTLVEAGESPGILAYCDGRPIGWCAVAPREVYVALARSRVLAPVDETPVWSVTCFFVAKDFRRQGVTVKLLRAAVDFVRERGGRVVEGYPVEPHSDDMPAAFAWTGLAAAFQRAGFKESASSSKARPIMRFMLRSKRS